jgi:Cu(I)/Ag(I) efflux system membrane fusion protein
MFADVVMQRPASDVLTVPASAVLQTGTRAIVFVVNDDGTFEPREVQTGAKSGEFLEVRGGLVAGERVATEANFLIDSESRLKAFVSQKAESRKQK